MPEVSANGATCLHAAYWAKRGHILVPYLYGACHSWPEIEAARPVKADCSGFQMRSMTHGGYRPLMERLGIDPPNTNCQVLYDKLAAHGWDLPIAEARWTRGTLVFWYSAAKKRLFHVGLVVQAEQAAGPGLPRRQAQVCHCSSGQKGVVITDLSWLAWSKAILLGEEV